MSVPSAQVDLPFDSLEAFELHGGLFARFEQQALLREHCIAISDNGCCINYGTLLQLVREHVRGFRSRSLLNDPSVGSTEQLVCLIALIFSQEVCSHKEDADQASQVAALADDIHAHIVSNTLDQSSRLLFATNPVQGGSANLAIAVLLCGGELVLPRSSSMATYDRLIALVSQTKPSHVALAESETGSLDSWLEQSKQSLPDNLTIVALKSDDRVIFENTKLQVPSKFAALPNEQSLADRCYLEDFHRWVEKTPDEIAIYHQNGSLSYLELQRQVIQVSRLLGSYGLEGGSLIGICLARDPWLVVAIMAAQHLGLAYVPIDPDFPDERISYILDDANAGLLLTSSTLGKLTGPAAVPEVYLDLELQKIPPESVEFETDQYRASDIAGAWYSTGFDPSRLAYVIYTSGSTGNPKGVKLSHGNLSNFLCSMRRQPGLAPGSRFLAITTVAFDIAQLELLLPLVSGATVCLASRDIAVEGNAIAGFMTDFDVTHAQATPSTWRLLKAAGWRGRAGLKALCGGEGLSLDMATWLSRQVMELWNMYGPTETTVWSSCKLISPADIASGRISIGDAIDRTTLFVRRITDDAKTLQLCEIDEPGELLIGGSGVAAGYHQRSELTTEKFIPDTVSACQFAEPDSVIGGEEAVPAVLYCTGDLVSRDASGNYFCHGRIDNQVKLRGYRIEPGEIEELLESIAEIDAAAVVLSQHNESELLVAYLVTSVSADAAVASLMNELTLAMSERLPEYMWPQLYARLDVMPMTPNAKLDRKALAPPGSPEFVPLERVQEANSAAGDESCQIESTTACIPDELSDTEAVVAHLWSELLACKVTQRQSRFFEIGGHSLLAMRFIIEARKHFSIELPFRCIATDTLAEISERLTTGLAAQDVPVPVSNCTGGFIQRGKRSVHYHLHLPADRNVTGAVLLVPPLGHEHTRINHELFLLAESLAANNRAALRFDFSGTGQSGMVSSEIDLADWVSDIEDVSTLLLDLSAMEKFDAIVIRAATLPFAAALEKDNVANLVARRVFWDPVLDGDAHINELRVLSAAVRNDLDRFRWPVRRSDPLELMGQVYSKEMLSDFSRRVCSLAALSISDSACHIIADDQSDEFSAEFDTTETSLQFHQVPEVLDWRDAAKVDALVTAPSTMSLIRQLLL